mmetsp:Transcript_7859/g.18043  ORF Transcript_7859/g.18043 Transcript_7859/m.18043 type:complete len:263 (+) Transcript_7859:1073-1861(+)
MLSTFLCGAHNQWVGLREFLEALNELWQVLAILDLHCHLHHWRHAVLHVRDVVSGVQRGDGSRLEDVGVNTHQGHRVATRHIRNLLGGAAHHQHRPLDVLDVEVLLAANLVVLALDPHLLARGNGAAEDTAKCVETTLVACGHHLGHVHHQRSVRLASTDGISGFVIHGTLVQILHAVLLCLPGRRKLCDYHGQQRVSSVNPDLHRPLHQGLPSQLPVVALQGDAQGAHHFLVLGLVIVHDGTHELVDRTHDKLAEGTRQRL